MLLVRLRFLQVEAALTNEPDSDELLKLKSDLNVSAQNSMWQFTALTSAVFNRR